MAEYRLKMGMTYPLGISICPKGFNIAVPCFGKKECGILLYKEGKNSFQIPFQQKFIRGNLYTIKVEGIDISEYRYQFYKDEEIISDPYARLIYGREEWGDYKRSDKALLCAVPKDDFEWENDKPLEKPYHESIFYSLHVRGFTKHASSKVIGKGCFLGVAEKIPYLKKLGITGIVLMPIYEFNEILKNSNYMKPDEAIKPYYEKSQETWEYKINYWGFEKGNYFAPKSAYAHSGDVITECKSMVKEMHKNDIEVLMRIYFTDDISQSMQYEILKFWVMEYHIDGFLLMGSHIPTEFLAKDPLLGKTKMIVEPRDLNSLYNGDERPVFKNMAVCHERFMYVARKFLKSDEDMLKQVAEVFRENPIKYGVVNYIADYQGFTLADLVSYDKKHNEANNEKNHDGNDYNYSWNCGVEGKTRRKQVVELRQKQVKNAWIMLMFSQGTPMLLSGDEFGNSTDGNNNPYCQDNSITWLNWKQVETNKNLYNFVKQLILLRKTHPILSKEEPFRIMDYISCGYPDLSYHGEMAWYPQFENYNRHLGIMYCGCYAKKTRRADDDFFFQAYNLHWESHEFALPKLSGDKKWYVLINTGKNTEEFVPVLPQKQSKIQVPARTILILIGK